MADPPGVSVAFSTDWNVPNPTWTRLDTLPGCRVQSWTVDRGRPNEFAKTGTGTATVTIVDLQGLFDPTRDPTIRPGLQAALSLWNPVSNTWHIRFRGFVAAWRYRLGQTRQHMELELELVDGFAMLARAELRVGIDGVTPLPAAVAPGNVYYDETVYTVRDRIYAILGDISWPLEWSVTDTDIFSGNVRVGPKAYAPGTSALDALWDAADAEFPGVANLYCAADGHLRFRGRQARFRPDVAGYGIQRRTVGDPSATGVSTVVPISELEWATEDTDIYNSVTATPEGVGVGTAWRQFDPAVDGSNHIDIAASIQTHGLQSLTFDNLQTIQGIASGNDAVVETRLFASYYAENYKQPVPRISRMVFKTRRPGAANSSALWQHLCNCEISDLLTVKTAHPGGGGFNADFYVEGIHYQVRPGPPEHAIVELSLDVSQRAHWTTNPFTADPDPA